MVYIFLMVFFFFKQKTAYEISACLVGSEMCIRDSVVNCNLQRLDGPVRGNGKIIQELEGIFRGAGWNVIKVIWGSYWDSLLAVSYTHLTLPTNREV